MCIMSFKCTQQIIMSTKAKTWYNCIMSIVPVPVLIHPDPDNARIWSYIRIPPAVQRQYGGSTAAVPRQYGGSPAAVRRQYGGNTAAV